MKQRTFFDSKSPFSKSRLAYGGNTRGKRKIFRSLDKKRPLHIVMKSSVAKGKLSLLAKKLKVATLIGEKAAKYRIKIHSMQNMGNHIHIMVSFKDRKEIQAFLRVTTGLLARLATGAQKGKAFGKRFWDHIAFTRIIAGRRDFAKMQTYMSKNEVERDHGGHMRSAMELHEKAVREAKRRKMSLADVMDEWAQKFSYR